MNEGRPTKQVGPGTKRASAAFQSSRGEFLRHLSLNSVRSLREGHSVILTEMM